MLFKDKLLIQIYEHYRQGLIKKIKCKHPIIYQYLINKFDDTNKISEIIYRIKHNIDRCPVCKTCGKPVRFINYTKGYLTHCCNKCAQKDPDIIKKKEDTCLEHFGEKYYWNSVDSINRIKDKYGVDNVFNLKEFQDKARNTCLQHYGVKYPAQNKDLYNKQVSTLYENYGVTIPCKDKDIEQKVINTKMSKYGHIFGPNAKETIKAKYGVEYPFQSKEILDKTYFSKLNNHSEHISFPEQLLGNILIDIYGEKDVIHGISTKEYPYHVDFFIKTKKLYIEYQGFWTHGDHPYNDVTDINEKINLEKLCEENKQSLYNAKLKIWCYKDPEKLKCAIDNNINFLNLYYINEDFEYACKHRNISEAMKNQIILFIKNLIESNFSNNNYKQITIVKEY